MEIYRCLLRASSCVSLRPLARHDDMRVIREYLSDEDFCEAPRSWAYWNSKMGRYPPPPLPKRHFEGDKT
jgi:hypothetical protein